MLISPDTVVMTGKGPSTRDVVDCEFGYTGHFHHDDSNLVLTYFRGYDAELGRWLSRDPIEEAGGINLYIYVGNDPINEWDPDGLMPAGHHVVPRALWDEMPAAVRKVFDDRNNRIAHELYSTHNSKPYDNVKECRYRKEVGTALKMFLKNRGKTKSKMSRSDAWDFAAIIHSQRRSSLIGRYNHAVLLEMKAEVARRTKAAGPRIRPNKRNGRVLGGTILGVLGALSLGDAASGCTRNSIRNIMSGDGDSLDYATVGARMAEGGNLLSRSQGIGIMAR